MSQLQQFQTFVRDNGKQLTGVNVPVVLSDEETKSPQLQFTFGWRIEIGVGAHSHGAHCPSGINCGGKAAAKDAAHEAAKEYVSGRDSLFNARFKEMLSDDIPGKFILKSQDLQSAPNRYVGSERCGTCHGSGKNSCGGCSGSGKTQCYSCGGRGRKDVSRYDSYSERTVYTTESCGSCWGSGRQSCSSCGGTGDVTCSPCNGGGYLYYSYTIDGDAKRSTKWHFETDDYHVWTRDFIKNEGLNIINGMINIAEIDVDGDFDGCTFVYAFRANLPTLQFTATIDAVDTKMCFAGQRNQTHDAGGVYDPAVWSIAKDLGAGHKSDDTKALATPAIKEILESQTTKSASALLTENWVSSDIKTAVMTNYETLVGQLKKQSVKGIVPKMFTGLIKFSYLFFMLSLLIALAFPEFAEYTDQRMGITDHPHWYFALLTAEFGLFGLPVLANYPIVIGLFWLSYKAVKKFSWKRLSKGVSYFIALLLTYFIPHIGFSLYYNIQQMLHSNMTFGQALVGGSLFIGFFMLAWGFNKPRKWYFKPLGLIVAAAAYLLLQFAVITLDSSVGLLPEARSYAEGVQTILRPAFAFIAANIIEIIVLSVITTYAITRRRFWLKSKTAVADYNSPVLLKSMGMD